MKLVMRIKQQDGSLAKAIYEEQKAMGWNGLAKEVTEICKKLGVQDVNETEMVKEELEESISMADYKEMKEDMERYEKLKDIKNGDFREVQDYMSEKSLDKGRMAFRIRTKMVKNVKMNFKNLNRNNLKCEKCDMEEDETQEHVMLCPGWSEERGTLDMFRLKDQVEFFHRMLKSKT